MEVAIVGAAVAVYYFVRSDTFKSLLEAAKIAIDELQTLAQGDRDATAFLERVERINDILTSLDEEESSLMNNERVDRLACTLRREIEKGVNLVKDWNKASKAKKVTVKRGWRSGLHRVEAEIDKLITELQWCFQVQQEALSYARHEETIAKMPKDPVKEATSPASWSEGFFKGEFRQLPKPGDPRVTRSASIPTSVTISWSPAQTEDDEPVLGVQYIMEVQEVDGLGSPYQVQKDDCFVSITEPIIKPNTDYSFRVRTLSESGTSLWTERLVHRTGLGATPLPPTPQPVEETRQEPTTLHLVLKVRMTRDDMLTEISRPCTVVGKFWCEKREKEAITREWPIAKHHIKSKKPCFDMALRLTADDLNYTSNASESSKSPANAGTAVAAGKAVQSSSLLQSGTTLFATFSTVNCNGESPPSPMLSICVPVGLPPPSGLQKSTFSKTSHKHLRFRWVFLNNSEDKVKCYETQVRPRSKSGAHRDEWEKSEGVQSLKTRKCRSTVKKLKANTWYVVRVRAIDVHGRPGKFSEELEARTRTHPAWRAVKATGAAVGGTLLGTVAAPFAGGLAAASLTLDLDPASAAAHSNDTQAAIPPDNTSADFISEDELDNDRAEGRDATTPDKVTTKQKVKAGFAAVGGAVACTALSPAVGIAAGGMFASDVYKGGYVSPQSSSESEFEES